MPLFTQEFYEWKLREAKTWKAKYALKIHFGLIKIFAFLGRFFLFEHLRKRGILVTFWVLNNKEDIQRGINLKGCRSIMTDDPPLLKQMLAS
jgi:hypothetical protein